LSVILRNFPQGPEVEFKAPWKTYVKGEGSLESTGSTLRLVNTDTRSTRYTDAQVDDYQGLARRQFLWQPPLQMTIRARFSHPAGALSGTAGFGFWNDPFLMTGARWPALPRVIWFFYSSAPSHIKLDMDTPGLAGKPAPWTPPAGPFSPCYLLPR